MAATWQNLCSSWAGRHPYGKEKKKIKQRECRAREVRMDGPNRKGLALELQINYLFKEHSGAFECITISVSLPLSVVLTFKCDI